MTHHLQRLPYLPPYQSPTSILSSRVHCDAAALLPIRE